MSINKQPDRPTMTPVMMELVRDLKEAATGGIKPLELLWSSLTTAQQNRIASSYEMLHELALKHECQHMEMKDE